jgi:hypothetical protein
MATILPTGANLNGIREEGTYLVTDPAGLDTGSYVVVIIEGADAAGTNYLFQRALNIRTGVEYTRGEMAVGFSDWVNGAGGDGEDIVALIDDELGSDDWQSGGGGGDPSNGVVSDPTTTGASPTTLDPAVDEVLFVITTGGTQGPEEVVLAQGGFPGQRLIVYLADLTDPADSITFDTTNIRLQPSAQYFMGTAAITFTDASLEDPVLVASQDYAMFTWDLAQQFWIMVQGDPPLEVIV